MEHAERFGLDFENQELTVRVIRAMDSRYLKWIEAEQERKRSAAKK